MSRATQEYKSESFAFHIRGHYPLGRCFPTASTIQTFCNSSPTSRPSASYNPKVRKLWFGLFPFRSPLFRVSRELRSISTNIRADRTQLILFSFPSGTEMFHFPEFASHGCYPMDYQFKTDRVSPFGNLRIKGYKPPPRSLSQVSRVLLRHPRPRHPPCTLMSLVRRPIYHNHLFYPVAHSHVLYGVAYLYPALTVSAGFSYSYVKRRCLLETKTALEGGFRVLCARGPYGLPLPKMTGFRFVDT